MKRAAVASAALLAVATLLTGCQKEEVEKLVAPIVADVQETPEATEVEEEKSPLIPEIDDTLSIEEGARIAVVSKSKKGEFWNKVKEGMEAAVKDVNEAYGFKKDKQITMTFEGPDDEEDVESQINTLDAVIAENPSVVCLSAGDVDSCQAQLEAAKENGIPVVAFDSNVSDTKLVRAFRGTDNTQIGKYAAYKLGSAIGKMGNVAVFSAQEKTQSAQERVKGFLDNIANYTDIKVVETVYSDQVDDMKEAMKEVLDKYPALDGVFCTNAEVSEMFLDRFLLFAGCIYAYHSNFIFSCVLMRWDIRPCGRLFSLLHRRRKQRLIRRFYLIRYGSMLRISKAKTLQITCTINK